MSSIPPVTVRPGSPVDFDEFIALLIKDVLSAADEPDALIAYAVTTKLPKGTTIVSAGDGTTVPTFQDDFWFAYVDKDPFALFEHEVSYFLVNGATGEKRLQGDGWWPLINGKDLWTEEENGKLGLARIYPVDNLWDTQPWMDANLPDTVNPLAPTADYGDAPDDLDGYEGITGKFPTLYGTANSRYGDPGAHTLITGEEMIGTTVSEEKDAIDPNDPDGQENLIDQDLDDLGYAILTRDATSCEIKLRFQVTVAQGAPDIERYINILLDADKDGQWKDTAGITEWVTKNQDIFVPPGSTQWIETDSVRFDGGNDIFDTPTWVRVLLTRDPLSEAYYNDGGWDGSGSWDYGEVEDWLLNFQPSEPEPFDPNDPNVPQPGTPSCDEICYDLMLPVDCSLHALVISGGDRPGRGETFVEGTANRMNTFFKAHLGAGNVVPVMNGSVDDVNNAIADLAMRVRCYDYVLIYIAAHGSEAGGIFLQNGYGPNQRALITPQQLNTMLNAIGICPDPQNFWLGKCIEPSTNCRTTIILESCHAGNFHDMLTRKGRQIITTSTAQEKSYCGPDGLGAFSGSYVNGVNSGNADANNDGAITIGEAFDFANNNQKIPKKKHQTPRHTDNSNCNCLCIDSNCSSPPLSDGAPCDDGDNCTENDVCVNGECFGTPKDCDDGEQCTVDACDPITGECINTPVDDETPCDDGDACTTGDKCTGGVCQGTPKNCDDSNPCTLDACDPITGECSNEPLENGTPCDDGDPFTENDVCTNGTCAGTPTDNDQDDVLDFQDNCPFTYNPLQWDDDADDIGNACDPVPVDCSTYCPANNYPDVIASGEGLTDEEILALLNAAYPPVVCKTLCQYLLTGSFVETGYKCYCGDHEYFDCLDCPGENPICPDPNIVCLKPFIDAYLESAVAENGLADTAFPSLEREFYLGVDGGPLLKIPNIEFDPNSMDFSADLGIEPPHQIDNVQVLFFDDISGEWGYGANQGTLNTDLTGTPHGNDFSSTFSLLIDGMFVISEDVYKALDSVDPNKGFLFEVATDTNNYLVGLDDSVKVSPGDNLQIIAGTVEKVPFQRPGCVCPNVHLLQMLNESFAKEGVTLTLDHLDSRGFKSIFECGETIETFIRLGSDLEVLESQQKLGERIVNNDYRPEEPEGHFKGAHYLLFLKFYSYCDSRDCTCRCEFAWSIVSVETGIIIDAGFVRGKCQDLIDEFDTMLGEIEITLNPGGGADKDFYNTSTIPDCDDANPCTEDIYDLNAGNCLNTALQDGTACDDGDLCTTGDQCVSGVCTGTQKDCDDGNVCTQDSCNPADGQCTNNPLNDIPCDDGNPNTDNDVCTNGVCQGTVIPPTMTGQPYFSPDTILSGQTTVVYVPVTTDTDQVAIRLYRLEGATPFLVVMDNRSGVTGMNLVDIETPWIVSPAGQLYLELIVESLTKGVRSEYNRDPSKSDTFYYLIQRDNANNITYEGITNIPISWLTVQNP